MSACRYLKYCLLLGVMLASRPGLAKTNIEYHVTGVPPTVHHNILITLRNNARNYEPLSQHNVQQFFEHSPKIIIKALQPYGYFKAAVIEQHIAQQHRKWHLYFNVQPGPRLIIHTIKLSLLGPGKNNKILQQQQHQFPIKKNQIFQSKIYEEAKQNLLQAAEQQGFLTAQFTRHVVLVNPKTNTAHIELILNTGPRYYFGPIKFEQNILEPALLQRYVHFNNGEVYSSQQLLELQQSLSNSNYFKTVDINPDSHATFKQHIPITVKLTPRKTQQYNLGLGYGTDTGARGSISWLWRRLNRQGHHVSATFNASKRRNAFLASYYIPAANPASDQWTITLGEGNDHPSNGDSHTQQVTAAYSQVHTTWRRTYSLSYQLERYRVDNISNYQSSGILLPSSQWTWLRQDDPLFTRHGYRLDWQVRAAHEQLLSVTSFLQSQLDGKIIYPIGHQHRALLHANIGATIGKHLNDKLPLTLRFFSGGSRDVRGYGYSDLGPGTFLIESSIEYQHHLVRKYYATTFFDTGNADNYFGMHLKRGVGMGILWISPIGPIALTCTKALDRSKHPNRIQIAMGPDLVT